MEQQWRAILEHEFGTIQNWQALSGGDTSGVYRFVASESVLVAKTSSGDQNRDVLSAERDGLRALASTNTVQIPEVLFYHKSAENGEVLITNFIESGSKTAASLREFGRNLARLHQVEVPLFGWTRDNFIGALPQSNKEQKDWSCFYVAERLVPQLHLAQDKGLLPGHLVPNEDKLHQVCKIILGTPQASPIHGDLWGGNYLINPQGQGVVIDPSFYHGHGEVDLAMSRLFGGFGPAFYAGYHEVIPEAAGAEERRDLYQLYYLLVHLNMFGRSYLSSVAAVLQRYFN